VLSVRGGSTEVTLAITEWAPTVDGYRFAATTTIDRNAAGVGNLIVGRLIQVRLSVYLAAA
jgi:hypothetical protein